MSGGTHHGQRVNNKEMIAPALRQIRAVPSEPAVNLPFGENAAFYMYLKCRAYSAHTGFQRTKNVSHNSQDVRSLREDVPKSRIISITRRLHFFRKLTNTCRRIAARASADIHLCQQGVQATSPIHAHTISRPLSEHKKNIAVCNRCATATHERREFRPDAGHLAAHLLPPTSEFNPFLLNGAQSALPFSHCQSIRAALSTSRTIAQFSPWQEQGVCFCAELRARRYHE
jgi:hypothetical protein